MPRRREVRRATGRHRKQPLRKVAHNVRAQRGLSAQEIDHRAVLQHDILTHSAVQASLTTNLLHNMQAMQFAISKYFKFYDASKSRGRK